MRRRRRRPLALIGRCGLRKLRQATAASTAAARSSHRTDTPKHPAERGGRAVCHGATPFETESTKTPRGTLAFDDAAQAALRNHRGRVHMNVDIATLSAFPATPNQAILQCLFIEEARATVGRALRGAVEHAALLNLPFSLLKLALRTSSLQR